MSNYHQNTKNSEKLPNLKENDQTAEKHCWDHSFCRNHGEPFTYLCQLLRNLISDIDQLCVISKRKTSHWCCLNKLTIYVCSFSQKRTPWMFGATGRRWKPRWAPLVNTLRHTILKINVTHDVTAGFNKGVGNCAVRFEATKKTREGTLVYMAGVT